MFAYAAESLHAIWLFGVDSTNFKIYKGAAAKKSCIGPHKANIEKGGSVC